MVGEQDTKWLLAKFEGIDQRFTSSERAVVVAVNSMDKRLDSMNEFRLALTELSGKMLTREEYNGRHEDLIKMVSADRSRLDKLEGDRGGKHDLGLIIFSVCAVAFGFVSAAAALWSMFHK